MSGYAYGGGGIALTRVEVSFDDGKTWELAELATPEKPRHMGRYWCWVFWEFKVDVLRWDGTTDVLCGVVWCVEGYGRPSLEFVRNRRGGGVSSLGVLQGRSDLLACFMYAVCGHLRRVDVIRWDVRRHSCDNCSVAGSSCDQLVPFETRSLSLPLCLLGRLSPGESKVNEVRPTLTHVSCGLRKRVY